MPTKHQRRIGPEQCRSLAETAISSWRKRECAIDAVAWLRQHPEIRPYRSHVLALAYEEYCLRLEESEEIDPHSFCKRFPDVQNDLARLIAVDECVRQSEQEEEGAFPSVQEEFFGFFLVRELGRGAVSRVYLARETALGERWVALKVARVGGDTEAVSLGRLDHPNIVRVHSAFEDVEQQSIVICMAYRGNVTLRDVLGATWSKSTSPLHGSEVCRLVRELDLKIHLNATEGRRRHRWESLTYEGFVGDVGVQIAAALRYAHRRGIHHLDLKPANILVTIEGEIVVLDFNLAHDSTCQPDMRGGTPRYMSPEHYDAVFFGNEDYDQVRADIYSLAAILYELLTGQAPYQQSSIIDSTASELEEPLYSPRNFISVCRANPRISSALGELVDRCLSLNPANRPSSAHEFAALLARATRPWSQRAANRITELSEKTVRAASVSAALALALLAPQQLEPSSFDHRLLTVSDVDLPAYSPFSQAIRQYRLGNYEQALQIFEKVHINQNNNPVQYAWHGLIAWKSGDLLIATAGSELAHQKFPSDSRLAYNAAIPLVARGKTEFALRRLNRAIEIDPNFIQARLLRLWLWRQQLMFPRDMKTIEEDLEMALPITEHWEVHEIAAQAQSRCNEPNAERIKRHLHHALKLGAPTAILLDYPAEFRPAQLPTFRGESPPPLSESLLQMFEPEV